MRKRDIISMHLVALVGVSVNNVAQCGLAPLDKYNLYRVCFQNEGYKMFLRQLVALCIPIVAYYQYRVLIG